MRILGIIVALLLWNQAFAAPDTKLILIGGGERPAAALRLFGEWSGKSNAKVLVIGWASAIPETYYQDISDELRRAGVQHFIPALMAPQGDKERKLFLKDLDQATGVFFTGGDQNKAMAVVEKFKFKNAIQSKFLSGVPFMGTSAGTAMMAETMMTGDSTPPGTGLGLLKAPLIDMHFLKRNREPRLLAAMESTHVPYGIGVDEAGALAVMNSESATVLGEPHVVFYHNKDGKLDRVELGLGQKFNLGEWHEN